MDLIEGHDTAHPRTSLYQRCICHPTIAGGGSGGSGGSSDGVDGGGSGDGGGGDGGSSGGGVAGADCTGAGVGVVDLPACLSGGAYMYYQEVVAQSPVPVKPGSIVHECGDWLQVLSSRG